MYSAVDVTEVDQLPRRDASQSNAIFFIIFILIGNFFLISLFVGITFDNFIQLRDEQLGVGLLSDLQKRWIALKQNIINTHPATMPLPPSLDKLSRKEMLKFQSSNTFDMNVASKMDLNTIRGKLYYFATSDLFERIMIWLIILNTATMSATFYKQPSEYHYTFEVVNLVFTAIFLIEATIKIIGLGVRQYFTDRWNQFDFIVCCGAAIEIITSIAVDKTAVSSDESTNSAASNVTLLRVMRLFRVSRLVRVMKRAENLKSLLRAIVESMPSLGSVGAILSLMYFVSAIIAMNLFATVENNECVDDHANFRDFWFSILTIYRVSTGEDWDCIMNGACDEEKGGTRYCFLFFVSFYVLVSFITLNLFIAIIIETFETITKNQRKEAPQVNIEKRNSNLNATSTKQTSNTRQSKLSNDDNNNDGSNNDIDTIAELKFTSDDHDSPKQRPSVLSYVKNLITSHRESVQSKRESVKKQKKKLEMFSIVKPHVTADNIQEFVDAWQRFDPLASGYINVFQFQILLRSVNKPLGVGANGTQVEIWKLINECNIVVYYDDKVSFTESLYSLCYRVDGCKIDKCFIEKRIHTQLNKRVLNKTLISSEVENPNNGKFDIANKDITIGVLLAVQKAQNLWKRRYSRIKKRKQLELTQAQAQGNNNVNNNNKMFAVDENIDDEHGDKVNVSPKTIVFRHNNVSFSASFENDDDHNRHLIPKQIDVEQHENHFEARPSESIHAQLPHALPKESFSSIMPTGL